MKDGYAREREHKRNTGECAAAEEKVPTYQELLDEALDETFPASDPISPTAAMHAARQVESPRDAVDWALTPGQHEAPGRASAPLGRHAGREGVSRRSLLTPALAREAMSRVWPMMVAAAQDRAICGTGFLSVVILDPTRTCAESSFDDAVLWTQHLGDPVRWDADYGAFARAKARLSWQTGQDSRLLQSRPHLLADGDSLLAGAVNFDGIVVGVSGAQPWYDDALALAIAAMLRGLALRAHAALVEGGTPTVSVTA